MGGINYWGCGNFYEEGKKVRYIVTNFPDIKNKIIPFFQKYLIEGNKSQDFKDFCNAAEIIKEKGHLTIEGITKIRELKQGMNKGRK